MMTSKNLFRRAILCGAIGIAGAVPRIALADQPAPSQQQIDALVADITAHKQLCDKVTASQPVQFKQCNNEEAQLLDRQRRLGLTDDTLNGKLQSRGWRWP